MTKTKSTKRALLMSALSLLMCVSMLIGTTFAWFTDQASTGVNHIQSGNLNLEVYHKVGDELAPIDGSTTLFDNVNGEPILWEPEAGAEETFVIKNEGTLALKYQFKISYTNATETPAGKTLADVLKCQVVGLTLKDAEGNNVYDPLGESNSREIFTDWTGAVPANEDYAPLMDVTYEEYLLPSESREVYACIYWPQSGIDNEFNVEGGLSIDLGIDVVATQYTYEKDSTDNQYDASAEYPVIARSQQGLEDALADASAGDTIVLAPGSNYELSAVLNQGVQITEGVTIDGNGATLTVDGGMSDGDAYDRLYADGVTFKNVVFDAEKLYIKGETTFIDCTFNAPIQDAEPVEGTVKFEDCTFNNTVHFAPAAASASTNGKFFEAKGCNFTKNLTVQGFEKVTLKNCDLSGNNWANKNMISYSPVVVDTCTFTTGIRLGGLTSDAVTCTGGTVTVTWAGGGSATVGA